MFCPNCGSSIDDDSLFCTNCGAKIEDEDRPSQTPVRPDFSGAQGQKAGGQPSQTFSPGPGPGMGAAPGSRPVNAGPNPQNTRGNQPKPAKKGKGGMIALIVIIAVLVVAIIAGAVIFIMIQRNRSQQIAAFRDAVERFEEQLDSSNYTSIQDAVSDLMAECQQAIENRDVGSISELEERINDLSQQLTAITDQITSLEELKNTYQELIADQYYVPEDLQQYVDDIFASLQQAIDDGAGDQLENMRSQMEELIQGLEEKNQEMIDSFLSAGDSLDEKNMTDDEKNSLQSCLDEVTELVEAKNFKQAIERAQEYANRAEQVAMAILARQEESEEAARQSEEEARRQSEEEARRQSEEEAKNDYICPDSSTRYLTEADLAGLSDWELLLARNEIYARHGRQFDDPDIRAYFESKSWYNGTIAPDAFDASVFNQYEKANIAFIQEHEQ